jgi:hypothetical protein
VASRGPHLDLGNGLSRPVRTDWTVSHQEPAVQIPTPSRIARARMLCKPAPSEAAAAWPDLPDVPVSCSRRPRLADAIAFRPVRPFRFVVFGADFQQDAKPGHGGPTPQVCRVRGRVERNVDPLSAMGGAAFCCSYRKRFFQLLFILLLLLLRVLCFSSSCGRSDRRK